MNRIRIPYLKENDYQVNSFLRFHTVVLEVRNYNTKAFRALKNKLDNEDLVASIEDDEAPMYSAYFRLTSLFTFSLVPFNGTTDHFDFWYNLNNRLGRNGFYEQVSQRYLCEAHYEPYQ